MNDVGPAARVEDVGFVAQPSCEGLAVAAIAYDPIGCLRPIDKPFKGAATTLEGMFHLPLGWYGR